MSKSNSTSFFASDPTWTSRLVEIPAHEYRSEFQRDRDRILYSKEFRRLSGKTQVFATGFDDNMRTRLTHTLEVAQIANTISKALSLNTDLTEAIAYGHDVGHTPFGHIGERTLNHIMNGCFNFFNYNGALRDDEKGFKHNLQSVRVVSQLESESETEPGLNLTKYTIWGILNHTSKAFGHCDYHNDSGRHCRYVNSDNTCEDGKLSLGFYENSLVYKGNPILDDCEDWSFEGIVVSVADEIAQRHHDIEDGIYAGLIDQTELTEFIIDKLSRDDTTKKRISDAGKATGYNAKEMFISSISKAIVDLYVNEFITTGRAALLGIKDKYSITSTNCFRDLKSKIYKDYKDPVNHIDITSALAFNKDFTIRDKEVKAYLMTHILQSELAQSMDGKASYIIRQLVKAYLTNPQQLPDATIIRLVKNIGDHESKVLIEEKKPGATVASQARKELAKRLKEGNGLTCRLLLRSICDYIAGMTDQFAYKQYENLYGTHMKSFG